MSDISIVRWYHGISDETNNLGLSLNLDRLEDRGKHSGVTLGAIRRGKMVSWVPGATILVWTKCARQETVTGVPWPHCVFLQVIGGPDGGSIHCPACREQLAAIRSQKIVVAPQPKKGQLRLF
jgi:hypothetical protein